MSRSTCNCGRHDSQGQWHADVHIMDRLEAWKVKDNSRLAKIYGKAIKAKGKK